MAVDPSTLDTLASGVLDLVLRFAERLRAAGVASSMGQVLDAVSALRHVDLADREQFKTALGATLVQRSEDWDLFEAVFEASFPQRRRDTSPHQPAAQPDEAAGRPGTVPDHDPDGPDRRPTEELLFDLVHALRKDDDDALRALAELAVERFGGMDDPGDGRGHRYFLYRVLRALDLSSLVQEAAREERLGGGEHSALEDRLLRDERVRRVEELRRMIGEQIRQRLVPETGQAPVGVEAIEDVDFLESTETQRRQMRRALQPLARKLAARVAHRRRLRRQGRIDVRRTIRRSLSAGGVPLDPSFKRPHVTKPDLVMLCDVSGSVAEFGAFTLALVHAMHDEFQRVRSFVFVDDVDEVTALVESTPHGLDPRHLLRRARVVRRDGHSDYGNVFERFWERYGAPSMSAKTTLIVTGDARNNYRADGVGALRQIHERSRRVYWLNPEPRGDWDTSDSVMSEYAPHCDAVFEVRNLRQLAECVYEIA